MAENQIDYLCKNTIMVREKLILIGGSGHCKSCIDVIQAEGRFDIAGIVENPNYREGNAPFPGNDNPGYQVSGYQVIGTDDDLPELIREYKNALITVGQIRNADIRIRLFNLVRSLGGVLPVIISPNAYVSRSALIGAGTIVMHHAIVNAEARIGVNCILNSGSLVEHETAVGDHCHISTYAVLNGQCRVGNRTFVGSRVVLSNNTNIGDDTVVSAGSIVMHSLDQPGTYTGNPLHLKP
jgi:sugar O-acyltransferase (sialic acid O-acetyltransferase NeuD family)